MYKIFVTCGNGNRNILVFQVFKELGWGQSYRHVWSTMLTKIGPEPTECEKLQDVIFQGNWETPLAEMFLDAGEPSHMFLCGAR